MGKRTGRKRTNRSGANQYGAKPHDAGRAGGGRRDAGRGDAGRAGEAPSHGPPHDRADAGGRGRGGRNPHPDAVDGPGEVRVIGGRLRGSVIPFNGDPRVRPMKDRVREAVFNLLGKQIAGAHVVDLFAGTGALAIEALSRGAARATLIERHFPTAKQCEWALRRFELEPVARVLAGDAFFWGRRWLHPDSVREGLPDGSLPWVVFCCPPYQLFYERRKELKALIASIVSRAPAGSRIVVESDERFDMAELCRADEWLVREYPPAIIAILRIDEAPSEDATSGAAAAAAETPAEDELADELLDEDQELDAEDELDDEEFADEEDFDEEYSDEELLDEEPSEDDEEDSPDDAR